MGGSPSGRWVSVALGHPTQRALPSVLLAQYPDLPWDFRLPNVTSINASGGCSWWVGGCGVWMAFGAGYPPRDVAPRLTAIAACSPSALLSTSPACKKVISTV